MKFMSFARGKVLGYYLNAYYDAKLANELIEFWKGERSVEDLTSRSSQIAEKGAEKQASILGMAYCYYCWNGFYDVMWGRVWERFLKRKGKKKIRRLIREYKSNLEVEEAYREFAGELILFSPFLELLKGSFWSWREFRKKVSVKNTRGLSKRELVKAMKLVQKMNAKNNLKERKRIIEKRDDSEKLKVARKAEIEGFGKRTIGRALMWASLWDMLFLLGLKLRFGKN